MEEIILSFKPKFFKALLTQKKHFEYRSRIPEKQTVAYLYLSSPAKLIVGKMILGRRHSIQAFSNHSNLSNDNRLNLAQHYHEGANYFSAIHSLSLLARPILLEEAKKLSSHFSAPQGYSYAQNYRELHKHLQESEYVSFEINPDESMDLLGLFTGDIVKRFNQVIETPDVLKKFI